ncbi:MAG: hypothetical protein WC719_02830 [Patescibacteria group bacterium]|jgi:hypothetical protein
MIKKYKLLLLGAAIIVVLFSAAIKRSQAQTAASPADGSDAIAVRIIPNPNHYSIVRWYESQGFIGAPQALTVDGYEAIRDGRTVYVNAANVNPSSRTIYTNIYLISYNQDSTEKTVDILGQIVAHWKFNNNIIESANPVPDCSISAVSCNLDADCGQDQYCATSSAGIASSSCLLKKAKNCLVDTDCPNSLFCNSVKSKITRDIKRVGQLEELKEALYNFKKRNNYYPRLSSGTYLANNSLSVWPSWTQSLLSEVAVSQSFTDPINRLGVCLGYDAKTCWNPDLKKFVYSPTNTTLTLPTGSYAFAYSTDSNGSNYNLCAVMESRAANLGYHFLPNDPISSACVTATGIISGGHAQNTAPQLVDQFLVGQANREFSGFLKVVDAEDNPLVWSISGPSWISLQDTSDPTQKKVYASSASTPGTYNLTLTVTDGSGGTLSTTTRITILADAPRIEAADAEYVLDPKVPFNYNFTFSSKNLNNPATAYTVTKTSGLPDVLNILDSSHTFTPLVNNSYKSAYTGIIPTINKFYQDTSVNYRINLTDKNGVVYPKTFNIKIIVEQPQLNFDCLTQARINNDYSCLLGSKTQGNHTLSYGARDLPPGLALTGTSDALISGRPTILSPGYSINIKTTNEYGASTSRAFILKINNYCGDGKIQAPNTEGRGGVHNDGYEDCDGAAGTTSNISTSSAIQYGCRTGVGSTVPNPILTNTYCVFKSPTDGGGYCGDGYCQSGILPTGPESACNCVQDCGEPVGDQCVCKYTYTNWSACQSDHLQTRTLLTTLPGGCTGTPVTSQTCATCVYTYSAWGACQSDHTQTRTVTSVLPSVCYGAPVTSQTCVCNNNGICDTNENIASCSGDCPVVIPSVCGDGVCNGSETALSCKVDCLRIIKYVCGDGLCDIASGETASSCPSDCDTTPSTYCGDGVCNGEETCYNTSTSFGCLEDCDYCVISGCAIFDNNPPKCVPPCLWDDITDRCDSAIYSAQ